MLETTSRRYGTIGVLSLSHLLNDSYSNYFPQLLPFLVVLMPGFTVTRAAILVSLFTVSSSFAQPVFGYVLDGHGKWWIFNLGTIWMAIILSLTGIVHGYIALVVLALLGGLGTAAFHPRASTLVNIAAGNRKAVLLSGFVASGNLGFALSPLLLIPLFQRYGLHASVFTVIPGILVTLLLLFFAPRSDLSRRTAPTIGRAIASLKSAASELSVLVGVIALRSVAYTGLLAVLPLYFKSQALSNVAAGHFLTIMLACGAIGGIIGGIISDYYGRKQLIVGSLIVATPLFFGFLLTHGIVSMILLGVAGAALMSNFSVTVIAAQEIIPDNKALAAGLSMGFAGGLGALAAILVGRIGDAMGLDAAVTVLFSLPAAAGLLGLLMKNRPAAHVERLSTQTGKAVAR